LGSRPACRTQIDGQERQIDPQKGERHHSLEKYQAGAVTKQEGLAQTDPEPAASRLDLTNEEREAVLAGDVGNLYLRGANAFLLGYPTRFGVLDLGLPVYNERTRCRRSAAAQRLIRNRFVRSGRRLAVSVVARIIRSPSRSVVKSTHCCLDVPSDRPECQASAVRCNTLDQQ
jgi:hypothetical protein